MDILIKYTLNLLVFSSIKEVCSGQNQVITPEVSILDEAPSIHSGRVINYPNRSVEIQGLVGEKVVMQCNVFNMPRSARRESLDENPITEVINDGLMSRDMSRWKVGQGKQQDSVRLEILSLDSTYEGVYSCECQYTGSVESARVERVLRIFDKPIVRIYPADPMQKVGCRLRLFCSISANPPVTEAMAIWSSNRTGTISKDTAG
ncbi:hypothetical protein D915_010494 [Fasciola hepatica]|uniref:Ig-like domain-containing protein n=1 Tax=Fasciola hepatica TaxID=6192 RepID=A0A4E0QVK6_FASHE|nr:hypothetical protein D915_010494 [Fasciola hepatica]